MKRMSKCRSYDPRLFFAENGKERKKKTHEIFYLGFFGAIIYYSMHGNNTE